MSAVYETLECYPRELVMGTGPNALRFPAPPAAHEACSGGFHQPGVLGGWHCPCPCHVAVRVELPFTAPEDGWYEIDGHRYRLSAGTTVNEYLLPTLDPERLTQNGREAARALEYNPYDTTPPKLTCLAHLQPEPCPTCAAYIAAGL